MTSEQLREQLRIARVKFVIKTDSRLMRFIAWFLRVTCINREFMTRYWTTVGRTIYLPEMYRFELSKTGEPTDAFLDLFSVTLQHELVHVRQYCKWWILYYISYLMLPIPFGLAWFRWRWEREAYMVNVQNGISIDQVVEALHQGYGRPWPREWMRWWFNKELGKRGM